MGADALNTLARGALIGASNCMVQREVLSSAMGNDAPLAALQEPMALGRALGAAAAAGLMAPLKALLGRSEEVAVDARGNNKGSTALILAATGGHVAAIAALLAAGAEVEAKMNDGTTAFMFAAQGGHAAAIAALLAAGAEVEATDNNSSTAIMAAATGGHAAAIAALLAAGAEVDTKNNDSITALMAAAIGGHAAAIAVLLTAGAEVDAKMNDGKTALNLAELFKHEHVARLLRGDDTRDAELRALERAVVGAELSGAELSSATSALIAYLEQMASGLEAQSGEEEREIRGKIAMLRSVLELRNAMSM